MNEFTLLFRGRGLEQSDRGIDQKWVAWIKDLDARGLITNPGQPLENTGWLIEGHGRGLRNTSFADPQDAITGFIVLAAHNLDEAVEISRGCPIFEQGGSVEVRPVLQPRL